MEMLGNGSNYISFAQHGVQMELNSALCSFATPPRRNTYANNNRRSDSHFSKICTPPSGKASDNLSKSLPKGSVTRNSPSRLSPSQLQTDFYAGAKFGERPSPQDLPKPPNHWMSEKRIMESKEQSCIEMTNSLKMLLKVQS